MFFSASFMNRFVYLNKWQGRRVPRNVVFGKGPRVYMCARACVYVRGRVCAVSGLAIEPCQTPRAKPSLLDRNCLFTGYTTVYLKTIGLAGLLQRTPCRYRYQASGSCFTTCLLCAIFFFRIASFIWNFIARLSCLHNFKRALCSEACWITS